MLTSLHHARRAPLRALFVAALVIYASALAHAQQKEATSTGNCTHPDPATRPDCSGAIAFFVKFQDALKRNDREAVASLVHYPLLATAGGKTRIRSRAQFLASYDRLFSPKVRASILKATADDVWGNYRGFMVGRGVIWFDRIIPGNKSAPEDSAPDATKYPFKLITVNPAYPG
jgi:hypothetical protein